jgi:hypothetical protein
MAIYNTTFMDNATNVLDLFIGINAQMGGSFLVGNMILMSFFMIFMSFAFKYDFHQVLVINSFLTTIAAILLYSTGIIAATTIIYPAVLFFVTLALFMLL